MADGAAAEQVIRNNSDVNKFVVSSRSHKYVSEGFRGSRDAHVRVLTAAVRCILRQIKQVFLQPLLRIATRRRSPLCRS